MITRTSSAILAFGFMEKLLYWTILPNVPIAWLNNGSISVSGLAVFFLCHVLTYRTVPALGGYWVDQRPPRFTLFLGLTLELCGLAALCLSQSILTGVLAGVIVGIGGGLVNPALQGVLGKRSLAQRDTKNFTYNYLLMNVGALAGPLLTWPLLEEKILLLYPVVIAWMFILGKLPDFAQQPESKGGSSFWQSLSLVVRDSGFVRFLMLCALFWGCYTMIFSSIPSIAKELGHPFKGNVWLAINAGTILLAHFTFTAYLTKFSSHWRAIFTGYLVAVCGMLLLAGALNIYMLIFGVIVLSVAELIATPPVYDFINETAPAPMRAQYVGFIWLSGALGEGGGQALLAVMPSPRIICVVMGVLLLCAVLAYNRNRAAVSTRSSSM